MLTELIEVLNIKTCRIRQTDRVQKRQNSTLTKGVIYKNREIFGSVEINFDVFRVIYSNKIKSSNLKRGDCSRK